MKLRILLPLLLLTAVGVLRAQERVACWERFELRFEHAAKGNPFDVDLSATFTSGDRTIVVRGFYDGDDTYRIRFMPTAEGTWQYVTRSSAAAMNRPVALRSDSSIFSTGLGWGRSRLSFAVRPKATPPPAQSAAGKSARLRPGRSARPRRRIYRPWRCGCGGSG